MRQHVHQKSAKLSAGFSRMRTIIAGSAVPIKCQSPLSNPLESSTEPKSSVITRIKQEMSDKLRITILFPRLKEREKRRM